MIRKYLNYLTAIRGYSQNTATSYEKDLYNFVSWAKKNLDNARWSTLTREDIDSYVTDQQRRGLKASTTNRRIAAISGFYNYLRREGYDIDNPCKFESRRKIPRTIPRTIKEEELRTAYEHANGVVKSMLGLLATTGIRIQELLEMRWEDIDFDEDAIIINGKGNKQRIVYSTEGTLSTLREVQRLYANKGQIFTMTQREARYMIWQALKPYCRAEQLSPHAIRHTYATNLAKHGANVTTIAGLLGHEHIKTTQKYIDMTQQTYKETSQAHSIIG